MKTMKTMIASIALLATTSGYAYDWDYDQYQARYRTYYRDTYQPSLSTSCHYDYDWEQYQACLRAWENNYRRDIYRRYSVPTYYQ